MYQEGKIDRMLKVIIVLLVAVVIGLVLLAVAVFASARVVAAEGPAPSQSGELIEEPSQPEVILPPEEPEKEPEDESESESAAASSSSSQQTAATPAQPKPSTGTQQKPAASSSAAASSRSESSSKSSASSSSSKTTYADKTYSKSGSYDKKQTLGDVAIKTGNITLENKTIKGDLTIARDCDDTITLVDCVVEGKLYIRGGQTVVLTDSRVAEIVVKEGYGQPVTLVADGKTKAGVITAYTGLTLDESDLDTSKTGFSELKVAKGDPTVQVKLVDTTLTKATLDEETDLALDSGSKIRKLRVNKPTTIDGTGSIELLTIGSDDITSYIVPEDEEKAKKKYDDVTYLSHTTPLAAPTGLGVNYTGGSFVLSWQAGDSKATGYEVQLSAEGVATVNQTVTATTLQIPDSFIGKQTTLQVRATTTTSGYSNSAWASLTYTPTQVGELTEFAITSVDSAGIHLKWNAVANAQSYTLSYRKDGAENVTVAANLTETTYTLGSLANGSYTFTLAAVGDENTKPAATGTRDLPTTVQQLAAPTVKGSYDEAANKLTYSWTAVENAGSYRTEGMTNVNQSACTGEFTPTVGQSHTVRVTAEGYYNQTGHICYLDSSTAEQTSVVKDYSGPTNVEIKHYDDGLDGQIYVLNLATPDSNYSYQLSAIVNGEEQGKIVKLNWDSATNALDKIVFKDIMKDGTTSLPENYKYKITLRAVDSNPDDNTYYLSKHIASLSNTVEY